MKENVVLQSLGFMSLLSLAVVALKGFGVIDISWWICFTPLYIWVICWGCLFGFLVVMFLMIEIIKAVIRELKNDSGSDKTS